MPYQWLSDPNATPAQLRLWPYRSLPKRGFVWFIGGTAALLALPLLTQLGTKGLWMLLPFALAPILGIWLALQHSYKTGTTTETLTLTEAEITLHRHDPKGPDQTWSANPHWVRVQLYPKGGPVPFYLTLSGNQREVELGAFLTEDERKSLYDQLTELLLTRNRPLTTPP